jgi:tRNA (cytidine/uridine-2'-O-)-methyltransferase
MQIVLVHPEIPPNTGSVGRLCAATDTELVLVKPLGFSLADKYLKRAGLDYWPWIRLTVTEDWAEAVRGPGRTWAFTTSATRAYTDADFGPEDRLVFGRESVGLEPEILAAIPESQHLLIPMVNPNVRSLNLAQCVAITLMEARRQLALTATKPTAGASEAP